LSIVPLLLTLSSGAYSASQQGIDCLLQAYPGFLLEKDGDNLVLADGHRLPYGSGSQGNFEDRLDHANLHDQMSQCYSPGFPVDQPRLNEDPGRMRHELFFKRLYGEDKLAVQRNIVQVNWAPTGKSLAFSRIAGADHPSSTLFACQTHKQGFDRIKNKELARSRKFFVVTRLA